MTETDARAVISVGVQNDLTGRSATAVDGGDAVGAATGRDGLGAGMRGAPLDLLVRPAPFYGKPRERVRRLGEPPYAARMTAGAAKIILVGDAGSEWRDLRSVVSGTSWRRD